MIYLRPLWLTFVFFCCWIGTPTVLSGQGSSDSLGVSIRPYGSFRGHFAFFNGEVELQENATRIGFELSVEKGKARYFAASELSLTMFRGNVLFNADASTRGGFVVLDRQQENQVFGTRLGYLGVDLGALGTFSGGKQWSVYYDIARYADRFDVFGGQGASTYTVGSDGGEAGTGRADQVMMYRNRFGLLHVGAQVQVKTALNGQFIDGYGFSAQVKFPRGLSLGAAYVRTLFNQDLFSELIGYSGFPSYFVTGASFVDSRWEIGLVYAAQSNGDLTESIIDIQGGANVLFGAEGLEAIVRYKAPPLAFHVGFNGYFPRVEELPVFQDFHREDYLFGLRFQPTRLAYFYAEYRWGRGLTAGGLEELDVLTLGLRFDLDRTFSRNFGLR